MRTKVKRDIIHKNGIKNELKQRSKFSEDFIMSEKDESDQMESSEEGF